MVMACMVPSSLSAAVHRQAASSARARWPVCGRPQLRHCLNFQGGPGACAQGAFRKVAVEAAACAKELTGTLKARMLARKDEAAECIQMLRKLGEPVTALQVAFPAWPPVRVPVGVPRCPAHDPP